MKIENIQKLTMAFFNQKYANKCEQIALQIYLNEVLHRHRSLKKQIFTFKTKKHNKKKAICKGFSMCFLCIFSEFQYITKFFYNASSKYFGAFVTNISASIDYVLFKVKCVRIIMYMHYCLCFLFLI